MLMALVSTLPVRGASFHQPLGLGRDATEAPVIPQEIETGSMKGLIL